MVSRILVPFFVATLLLTSVSPVCSEAPSWEAQEESVLFMRRHALLRSDLITGPNSTDGIWQLTPDGTVQRLRPFFATTSEGATAHNYFGEGSFMTVSGDRLLFQSWPAEIHFDMFSWRMVNRLSVSAGLRDGWALQGPYLDPGEVSGSGLEAGVYGIARCLLYEYTSIPGGWVVSDCAPITLPGIGEETIKTRANFLLFEEDSPGWVEDATLIHTFPNYYRTKVLLSFDPEQKAFWRGTVQGAQLFPVENGEVQASALDLDLSQLPFGIEESALAMLYYHPRQNLLFGNQQSLPNTSTERDCSSHWQTDLYGYLMAIGGSDAKPTPFAAYHPSSPDACAVPTGREISGFLTGVLAMPIETWRSVLGYPPGGDSQYADPFNTIFPDVVHLFSECEAAQQTRGGLEIVTGSWFSGFTRTYTTRQDGGTYGSMLPLYPPGGWPVQHFAGLEVAVSSRINIGLFNGNHDVPTTYRLTLYSSDGVKSAEREVVLEPLASLQKELKQLLQIEHLQSDTYGLTVLPLDEDGTEGRSWAYVSVVDNISNDPINLW